MGVLVAVFGVVLVLSVCSFLLKWNEVRYGNLYKTHILGCPTVICMDPELNRLLMNEGKGLIPGYPQSMLDILGKYNIAAVHGSLHKTMRGAMLALIGPTMVREQLMPKIDEFMRSHLHNLNGEIIDIQDKTKEMALLVSLKLIGGIESGLLSETFKPEFYRLVEGTISLPIDLPGTNYHHGFQARKKITSMLSEIINERRNTSTACGDMLDALLKTDEVARAKLTDEQIVDLILTIIYSGYETVSTTSMMAIKYLHDNPKALEELREEHFAIRKGKSPEDPIDWNDYKSMNFTRAVIYETLRMATVINGLLRKTTQDMEMKGYVIPKGWKIYVYDKNLESHQCFLMFGGGSRLCPGKEIGTTEISVFLHYFVTRYRWEEVGNDKLVKFPRVEAPNGIRVRVSDY
ncbi:Cytochrome P450 85A1 [Acorus calamus]|uniref:Cytochrome P450 85A1 n=1 Tax=Acorus calamus TaxID=4465 RepID=A0AAV9DYI5_ACOCL|nr:Cytochrome P450 85A1 [Acorus calamus]